MKWTTKNPIYGRHCVFVTVEVCSQRFVDVAAYSNGRWCYIHSKKPLSDQGLKVVAWRPKPKPYKGKSA